MNILPGVTLQVITLCSRGLAHVMVMSAMILSFAGQPTQGQSQIRVQPGNHTECSISIQDLPGQRSPDGRMHFLLYVPPDYDPQGEPRAVLLFLHGYGESGHRELERVKIHGPPGRIDSYSRFPFVLIAPQCPPPTPDMQSIRRAWDPPQLERLLDEVARVVRCDPHRVYVTGLSMGGYGTWRLVAHAPERFAAAAPVCGGGDPAWAEKIARVPVWCFHGAKDEVVPLSESQRMVDAVRRAGGQVEFTVYPEVGHDAWKPAYADEKLLDWFLRHQRPAARPDDP